MLKLEIPKITIVTPSYNQGQYLERTILSVLRQQYPALEYIIMDGGSTDNSVEIIKRYADRLSYWKSGPDGGQSAAIAEGFALSSGEILSWLNSDDLLMPNALTNVAKAFLTSRDVCAVTGRCVIIDAEGKPFRVNIPIIRSWRSMVYLGSGFTQMATFWQKSAYHAVGQLDSSMYCSFDADLFVRLKKYGQFKIIPNYLAAYRSHKDTKTSSSSQVTQAEDRIIMRRYTNASRLMVELSYIARCLRPTRRIRDKFFWHRDKHKLIELCRTTQT